MSKFAAYASIASISYMLGVVTGSVATDKYARQVRKHKEALDRVDEANREIQRLLNRAERLAADEFVDLSARAEKWGSEAEQDE